MKPMAIVGLVLIVAGIVALIYKGIPYTTRETVVDIGPIQATAEREGPPPAAHRPDNVPARAQNSSRDLATRKLLARRALLRDASSGRTIEW